LNQFEVMPQMESRTNFRLVAKKKDTLISYETIFVDTISVYRIQY